MNIAKKNQFTEKYLKLNMQQYFAVLETITSNKKARGGTRFQGGRECGCKTNNC